MAEYTVVDRRASSEFRDPRGATQNIGWHSPGQPKLPVWNAEIAFRDGYYATALVNRAINIIADRISQLPFRAGSDPDDPDNFNKNSPLAKLLGPPPGMPNPEFSSRALWKHAIRNYIVTGRFGWEIETGLGGEGIGSVVGLWPLIVGALRPIPTNAGRSYFDGFEYNPQNLLQPLRYRREEVVYAWNQAPDNPREPFSPLQAIRWNATVILQIDMYNYAFIKNDAKPSTLVVHAPFATPEAQDAWRHQFSSNYAGPLNANRTMFNAVDPGDDGNVGAMIDVKTIGATAKDSQLAEIYNQQLDAVTTGLGVPMSLMDSSDRTFSNADAEMQNFYELTILPYCYDFADAINRDLAPKLGDDVGWFDISKVAALKPRLSPGWTSTDVAKDMLTNERRAQAGLGPVDMAELDAERMHNIELSQAAATPMAIAGGPPPASPTSPEPTGPVHNGAQQAQTDDQKKNAKVIPISKAKSRLDEIETRQNLVRATATQRLTSLATWILTDLASRAQSATKTRAEGKRGRQAATLGDLYDRSHWYTEATRALRPLFEAALTVAEATLAGMIPPPPPEDGKRWVDYQASDLAYTLVNARHEALERAENVDLAFSDPLLGASPADLASTAYDDAVADLSGVSRSIVTELVTRLASGDIDLDQAIGELTHE